MEFTVEYTRRLYLKETIEAECYEEAQLLAEERLENLNGPNDFEDSDILFDLEELPDEEDETTIDPGTEATSTNETIA